MIQNLDLYAAFVELACYPSISDAAQSMHISQPALSAKIARLENSLGVKLIIRTNRGFKLTVEGEELLENLNRGFARIEFGENRLKEIANLESGLMRVGASDMTLRFFLLDKLEKFRAEHPKVKIAVTNAPTPQTLKALHDGMIDFCVISEPVNSEANSEFAMITVRKDIQDIFVCTKKYEHLLNHEVTFEELVTTPLILLGKETSTRRYIDKFFLPNKLCADIELATSDLLLEFARRSIGVACIVEDFAKNDLSAGNLFKIKLKQSIPPRKFFIAYSKKLPLPAAASQFIKTL